MSSVTGSNGSAQASEGLDRRLLMVASVVVLGVIMSILDTTVVNVAINTLARDFDTELSTIQWIVTGYTLALATVIPVTGWAADRFGTKRLYMISIGLFLAGSALSGAAWSAESLIFFRVLQGLGGGMLMPAGMTILTRAAGPSRVGRVMAIIGVPMMLGPILGPILGGWLVDDFSWRWIFFINVPIGIAALIASSRILPKDSPQSAERFDLLGLALLSPGLALMIFGLAKSASSGGFGAPEVWAPALIGAALIVAFVLHALRTPHALIDLDLFKNRTFAVASGTLILMIISVFGAMLLLPLYLQAVRGETAFASGLLLAPQGIGAMIAMPIAGQLTDKTGVGKLVIPGLAVLLASTLGLTQLTGDTSYVTLSAVLFVMGIGMGFSMMPLMSGAMQTLRHAQVARASTSLNIIQQVGASIGTAVMSVILTVALQDRLPGGGGAGNGLGATGADLPLAVRNVMASAFTHTYWWAAALIVPALLVAFLLPRVKPEPVVEEPGTEGGQAPVLMHV
ncbi:DHA2 family efflux MFS transporter permease subunit [Solirubrobacter ginsenosidimutans]|uniref:DHA2 family efflux MFS transporter permease subunit n=1 Tax=Solirubrobacter ginsenosidimutans TaxID=490573 RepID=A0A9X3SB68_9ACTN|nr:DHA2 family efflux MFS transporter permease subunit [Solirubrobacter ginsenosidimutans]MDA0166663.1 DHA2 family efflux MFS transporter permease subunit [Solirubrobacter ginsenosidimutans]